MSGNQNLKRARASTRDGRERAVVRQEIEQTQQLIRSYLLAAREAGRCISVPEPEKGTTDKLLRAEANLLDRKVRWNDPVLHEFVGEDALTSGETRAERAEKIVKRVKARLVAAEKNGRARALLLVLDGTQSLPWPAPGEWTTFGFANFWARRVGFQSPDSVAAAQRAGLPPAPPGWWD